jgi:DNA-binding GntR family transcriptional regulator
VGRSVREHWDIYRKFEAGDERAVERAIVTHFRKSSQELKRELIKQGEVTDLFSKV